MLRTLNCFLLIAITAAGCSKRNDDGTVQQTPPSDEQKVEIAAQVLRGERPQSDLQKYGIKLGKPITGDAAKEQFLKDLQQSTTQKSG